MVKLFTSGQLEKFRQKILANKPGKRSISISCGTCGQARGALKVAEAFKEAAKAHKDKISIKLTGCHGFCEAEPNVIIFPEEIFYRNLKPEDAEIVVKSILDGDIADGLIYRENGNSFIHVHEIPFYKKQMRILSGKNPLIDPVNIEDYIAQGGYKAMAKALCKKPEGIIEEIISAGLRGRGGAGFSTGRKWEITRSQKGDIKYLICNADEGDPGAYMDRSLLEGNPNLIIEGMIIAAYAIGANESWVYVRNEYPLAVENVTAAIKQARELGLLGEDILGSGFDLNIKIAKGAGAFVCGEETALITSIEGKRGIPKQRPPFPAQYGLFGKPTNINNVETLANIPVIIDKGADWFAGIGTKTSKGTKIFSLVGNVRNTGLVEVPMGITLREVIFDIGGALNSETVKAVQIGGPSGGCIPQELFHLPVDYESLTGAGAIMGSGGMIVMDENTCMVDIARYFTNFLQEESCGKCSICREGTQRMHEILTDITEGRGKEEDLDLLKDLGSVIKDASMCGLGQTAPNPMLSTLEYFRNEYIAHIKEKRCHAGICKALIQYLIDPKKCTGCGLCKKNCPQQAVEGEPKKPYSILQEKCIKCGVCYDVCKFNAVGKENREVKNA